jgi:predicted nucleotidyltransferase component of viral defense system
MISRLDLDERVREWGLSDAVVEKDYVIGWLLWGIGADEHLAAAWAFKGGTCLKKCYIETYRFSEDLDFTVLPGGPLQPDELTVAFNRLLARVNEESGIDFSEREPSFRLRPSGVDAEGRIFYRGPRRAPNVATVKIDLSASERLVRPIVLRPIAHAFPDTLPGPATVPCYSFEEVFAEKIRAMGERGRPRDLYDIVNLFRRDDMNLNPSVVRAVLREKCVSKGVPISTMAAIEASPYRAELEAEWPNMLAHQLPGLPPFESFWGELPKLFAWLETGSVAKRLAPIPVREAIDTGWAVPPTMQAWGMAAPVEPIRFAAANRLCIELGYQGTRRLIEPYSFRRSKAGNLLLCAVKVATRETRTYRLDRIESVRATNRTFVPAYLIELGSLTSNSASELKRAVAPTHRPVARHRSSTGITNVVRCTLCGREFERSTASTTLREHKTKQGRPCPSRSGYHVRTTYGR